MENKPMPLKQFLEVIGKLAKTGQWTLYREAIKKRKEWFKENNIKDTF